MTFQYSHTTLNNQRKMIKIDSSSSKLVKNILLKIYLLFNKSHMRILQSSAPEINIHLESSFQNFNELIIPPCPRKLCVQNPLSISHTFTVLSADPVATNVDVPSTSITIIGASWA